MSKWIKFVPIPVDPKRKTAIYEVRTKDGNFLLGEIKWYGAWRCYSFFPKSGADIITIYEKTCLRDLATFCEQQTDEHKNLRKSADKTPPISDPNSFTH